MDQIRHVLVDGASALESHSLWSRVRASSWASGLQWLYASQQEKNSQSRKQAGLLKLPGSIGTSCVCIDILTTHVETYIVRHLCRYTVLKFDILCFHMPLHIITYVDYTCKKNVYRYTYMYTHIFVCMCTHRERVGEKQPRSTGNFCLAIYPCALPHQPRPRASWPAFLVAPLQLSSS